MIYRISFFFLSLQLLTNCVTRINIPAELYFLPWLVFKGLVPYRDFFDHHGSILYYLLAPFTQDQSLTMLKFVFVLVQMLNLILFQNVLKKKSLLVYILGNILFLLLNYIATQNLLWYDTFIQTSYLAIFILLTKSTNKLSVYVIGLFLGFMALIKITALAILVPILIFWPRKLSRIFVSFSLVFVLFFLNLFKTNSFSDYLRGVFQFNKFLSSRLELFDYSGILDFKIQILIFYLIIAFTPLVYSFLSKQINFKKFNIRIVSTIMIGVCSLSALFSGVHLLHLIVFVPFMTINLLSPLENLNQGSKAKILYFFAILCFLPLLVLISIRIYRETTVRGIDFIRDPKTLSAVRLIEFNNLSNSSVFVYGDNVQIYYYLNLRVNTKYPLKFPMYSHPLLEDFDEKFEDSIISGLKVGNVNTVIYPTDIPSDWLGLPTVNKYIADNFYPHVKNEYFTIYRLKNGP